VTDPISCLIADDQTMVREGFGALLAAQSDLTVVGQAADGAEAVRLADELGPDVILMDVRMPVMDGLDATRRILDTRSEGAPRILMLTTFDLDEYVYEALRAGASGFLLKDAPADELVHAVRVVAAGDALVAPSVMRRLIADFIREPRTAKDEPVALHALTPREREVLVRPRPLERRDQRNSRRCAPDDQDPRRPHLAQASPARPRPGGRRGLRVRPRRARGMTSHVEPDAAPNSSGIRL
jgi:DNA-binding NarL/FixJ family response regulator